MLFLFRLLATFALTLVPTLGENGVDFGFAGRGTSAAVVQVVARTLEISTEQVESKIVVDIAPASEAVEHLWFQIEDLEDGRVKVSASSGPDAAFGVGTYLREQYNISVAWERAGGRMLNDAFKNEPHARPIGQTLRRQRNVPISYFGNVVTFSYSFVWYSMKEWEKLIDWMALNGINLVPAYTGQEEIYRKTFNHFGVGDETFAAWSNNIGFLAWSRGQNLHGCFGPLPVKVMRAQWELQKKILSRLREIGIVPVLPAFQGNVPDLIRQNFPAANISKTGIAWIDGTDPLFLEIQRVFMKIMIADWGTDHWYETDGYFNHESEPWLAQTVLPSESLSTDSSNRNCRYNVDPTARHHRLQRLNRRAHLYERREKEKDFPPLEEVEEDSNAKAHSSSVYSSLQAVDPKAVWLYQGWIWRGWGKDKLSYMKGFVSGVPKGRFVLLDMFDEVLSEWDKFDYFAYFGVPFIWSVLHNFGGNVGMWGSLPVLNEQPFQAFQHAPRAVAGVGAAPEGIDQNPVYYDMLYALSWRAGPTGWGSVNDFLEPWTTQRYGVEMESAKAAWRLLGRSVYGGDTNEKIARQRDWLSEKSAEGITALVNGSSMNTPNVPWYNADDTLVAWKLLTQTADHYPHPHVPRPLEYDLVNVGREVLAKHSSIIFKEMVSAAQNNEISATEAAAKELIDITLDTDALLCSESSMMTRTWLDLAENLAREIDAEDEGLRTSFLLQARSQTTTWGIQLPASSRPDSTNLDYANKQWGGQLAGFYALRHKCFLQYHANQTAFNLCIVRVSSEWINDVDYEKIPVCNTPSGNAAATSRRLIQKWFPLHLHPLQTTSQT